MRHRTNVLLPALALAIALGARPARAEDEPTTKSYDEKGFSITVPAGWTLSDAEGQDAEDGYVCVAERELSPGLVGKAWALVKDAGGATAESLLATTRDNVVKSLTDAKAEDIKTEAWAGRDDARNLRIVGKASNGTKSVSRIHAAVVNGKYHQLHLRAYGGAEEKLEGDFDAIASGYKFLDAAEGAGAGAPGGEGQGGGDAPGGADSRTIRFSKRGFSWKLPPPPADAAQPRWDPATSSEAKPDRDVQDTGLLAVAALHVDPQPIAEVRISAPKATAGVSPKGAIAEEGNWTDLVKNNFDGIATPDVDEDYKVGNLRGATRTFTGKGKDGRPLFIRVVLASIRDVLYEVVVIARDNAQKEHRDALKAALEGLVWDDAKEGPRGPWGMPFASLSQPRKSLVDLGKDAPIVATGIGGKKPAAFGQIRPDPGDERSKEIAYAAEARKGDVYMFFSVRRFDGAAMMRAKPPKEIESIVDERETQWKDVIAEPKTLTQRSGKANKAAESWKGAKGFKYEFSGDGNGYPVVERGWVVKTGTWVFWVQTQYVGAGAEAAFAADWHTMQASLKFL